ncbi:MAG TPA: hypothetical protein VI792_02600 [Candidatus Eisenbacteria bacterium]
MRRSTTLVAALVLAACALAAGVGSRAAVQPSTAPANPHGRFHGECGDCHGSEGWTPAKISPRFNHAKFGFPLEGAHAAAACRACHATLDFSQEKTQCVGCHQDVHQGELGIDCARCHTPRTFIDRAAMVRAHQLTRFPLSGAHASLDCESCHPSAPEGHMQFVGTPPNCSGCHMADYRATTDPDHSASGFPVTCQNCHSSITWKPASFDHNRTAFPLTGAHRATPCMSCHGDGVYKGKATACVSCHLADYNGTTNPVHSSSGFSTACEGCHNTTSWAGAAFDHNKTAFPLTGAHITTPCQSCHGDGVYAGKSTACVSCHQNDYNGTTNPAHAAAGFSTACQSCHNTTNWSGATFNHDGPYFPIYSGTHAGRWNACTDCHTSSTSYQPFTCFNCHPHDDKAQTDSNHSSVSGYSYDSNACYSCHPRGTK